MRIVGHRSERGIVSEPSGRLLAEGARASDDLRAFPGGGTDFVPKGVYRFMTHEQANRHWVECLAEAMARLARNRR